MYSRIKTLIDRFIDWSIGRFIRPYSQVKTIPENRRKIKIVHYAYRGESEGIRTSVKVIASCQAREWLEVEGRGFSPREKVIEYGLSPRSVAITFDQVLRTLREFTWPLLPRGAYTIVRDAVLLEWLQLLPSCGWWAGRKREYRLRDARGSGAQPRWSTGVTTRRGVRGAPPPTVTKRT